MPHSFGSPREAARNPGRYRVHYRLTLRNDLEGNGEPNRNVDDHVDVTADSERGAINEALKRYNKDLLHTPRDARGNPVMSDLQWLGVTKL